MHAGYQRQGVGIMLLEAAAEVAKEHQLEWLHVDFEPEYESFYRKAGFEPTGAGLLRL